MLPRITMLLIAATTAMATVFSSSLMALEVWPQIDSTIPTAQPSLSSFSLSDRSVTIPAENDIFMTFVLPKGLDANKPISIVPFGLGGSSDVGYVPDPEPIATRSTKIELYCKGSYVAYYPLGYTEYDFSGTKAISMTFNDMLSLDASCDGRTVIQVHGASSVGGIVRLSTRMVPSTVGTLPQPYLHPMPIDATIRYTEASGNSYAVNNELATPPFHLDLRKLRVTSLGLASGNQVVRGTGPIGVPMNLDINVKERAWRLTKPLPAYSLTPVDTHGCDLAVYRERLAPDQPLEITVKYPLMWATSIYELSWGVTVTIKCPTPGPRVFNLNLVTKIS